jgi:hypothetical protein
MPKLTDNPWLNSMAGTRRKAKREAMGYSLVGTTKTIPFKNMMTKTEKFIPHVGGTKGSKALKGR